MSDHDDVASMSIEDLLREAISWERENNPDHTDFALGQLYASAVAGDEGLERIWQEETSPDQVELDLHLVGESVDDHATGADTFTRFVSGLNMATKAIVREQLGLRSLDRNLLIEGALPGSVRVVLRAPEVLPTSASPRASGDVPMLHGYASSPDSEALRTLSRLLTTASIDDAADSGVGAEIRDLPRGARRGLGSSVAAVIKAGWEIDGRIRQRRLGASEVRLSQAGARRLEDQLKRHQYEESIDWVTGVIDGFRRSLGSLYLNLPSTPRPVLVAVPDHDVLERAAALAADENTHVRARVKTVRAIDEGNSDSVSVSRVMLDVEPAPHQGTLD